MLLSTLDSQGLLSFPVWHDRPPYLGECEAVPRNDRPEPGELETVEIKPDSLKLEGDKVTFEWELRPFTLPAPIPNANGFYHELQGSEEYAEIVKLAIGDPAIQTLLMVTIAATLEAKAYQDSGKGEVDMSTVKTRLEALVSALPATVGATTKAAIVAKINEVATAHYAGFTLE